MASQSFRYEFLRLCLVSVAMAWCSCLKARGGAGELDTTFNVSANGAVYALLTEPNGEIMVGGAFTSIGGVTRYGLAKLYPNGTVDANFTNSINSQGTVYAMALQPDGRLLVGGSFSAYYTGQPTRLNVARLNVDGSIDGSFTNSSPNSTVYALGLQTNGQVLIGGSFISLGSYPNLTNHYYIARLNADGTVDNSFNAGTIAGSQVYAIAVQADGNILIGGSFNEFTTFKLIRQNVARLLTDGTPDTNYQASASSLVESVFLEPGGKSLWGGNFFQLDTSSRQRVGRFNPDGTVDGGFTAPVGPNGSVYAVTEDGYGNVYVGGILSSYNGATREGVARLFPDGTLDGTFNVTTNFPMPQVRSLAVQSDGKVLVGGVFSTWNSTPCTNLVRLYGSLYPAEIVTQPQSANAAVGAGVTFSVTVSNPTMVSYQWLYDGVDIPGATDNEYSLFNLQLADAGNYSVFVSTAEGGTSSTNAVLQIGIPPAITQPPTNATVTQGSSLTFTAAATGTALNYYWINGKRLLGTNTTLTLTNLQPNQTGSYAFIASNFLGSVTSAPATLTVYYPITIVAQPASFALPVGGAAWFSVGAIGNPLNYQWFKDGTAIPGATLPVYALNSVALTDAGSYFALVTNQFNSVTSSFATLAVGIAPQTIHILVGSNGWPEIRMAGTAGFNYELQTATNFSSPMTWQNVITFPTDTNGLWDYLDTNGFTAPALYYRVTVP